MTSRASCHWQPLPDQLTTRCRDCGHAATVHGGTDGCVVCDLTALRDEFAYLLTPEGRRAYAVRNGIGRYGMIP